MFDGNERTLIQIEVSDGVVMEAGERAKIIKMHMVFGVLYLSTFQTNASSSSDEIELYLDRWFDERHN